MKIKNDKQHASTTKRSSLRLLNVYSEENVGDAAIYASMREMANSYGYKDVQFNNDCHDQVFNKFHPSFSKVNYMAVGGDIFNNSRPSFITRQFIKNVSELRRNPSLTAVFGQSIPKSCRGLSFRFLCSALQKMRNVTVRDQESFERLNAVGVKTRLSYDVVFTQKPQKSSYEQVLAWFESEYDFSEVAIISIRSFDALYQHDNEKFIRDISLLCMLLKQNGMRPVILLQSKVNESDGDLAMVEAISSQVTVDVIDPFYIQTKIPSLKAWQIAQVISAQAAIAVGVRYHTSVFRLAAGKIPFNLYYSNKGFDLSKRLQVPSCDVSSFNPERDLPRILATRGQSFDAQVISDQVRTDFGIALGLDPFQVNIEQEGEK
jgi:polysaccharide pyruvyl transferase WcaK-like protein